MKIGIAVFSGTGNTAHVAGLLGKELQGLGATVEIQQIDANNFHLMDAGTTDFDPTCYDLVGIGHPILGFGSPPLVLRFAEALPHGRGRMFIFKSAADNHRVNNSASEDLIRILEDKGYEVVHDFRYVMPCNWIISSNLKRTRYPMPDYVKSALDERGLMAAYKWSQRRRKN